MIIEKVLVVDDDEDIRLLSELALRRIGGWEVAVASSGEEALERAREQKPDVILLDVMMPRIDGPTTLAMLREEPSTANVPVIFLTAKVQQREVDRYRALGARGVIRKPAMMRPMQSCDTIWSASGRATAASYRESSIG
jgi:CheY-like chemotaxis protein